MIPQTREDREKRRETLTRPGHDYTRNDRHGRVDAQGCLDARVEVAELHGVAHVDVLFAGEAAADLGVGLDVTGRVGEEEVGRARQGGGGCFGPGYNEALYVVEDCGSCEGLVRTLLVWLAPGGGGGR